MVLRGLLVIAIVLLPVEGWAFTRVVQSPTDAACKKVTVNDQGSGNADITVDATAGGVSVMAANSQRCGALLTNSSANDMRCGPTTITVTSTVGYYVKGNTTLELGLEGQQAWRCIRTGGSSATASVAEATP